ncbi:MAG: hypothetical protein HY720_25355 [Planctomycetes bacterium]|nr:hypothetical protein [Planctomycetota bacterium]
MARKKNDRLDRIERMIEELTRAQDRTEEAQQRTEEEHRLTEEALRRLSHEVGDLVNGMGQMSENLLAPSLPRILEPFGITLDSTITRLKNAIEGETLEIDAVGQGRDRSRKRLAIVVEIKFKLLQRDVDRFLEKTLPRFREFFPSFGRAAVAGAVGGLTVPVQVARYAERKGLFVLGPGEEFARALNRPAFRPRIWPPDRKKR